MADISLVGFLESKKYQFGLSGSRSDRFEVDIVNCVNRAVGKINRGLDLATRIPRISSMEGTLTGLDETYEDVLSEVVTHELVIGGTALKRGEIKDFLRTPEQIDDLIDDVRQDILNIASNADTTDEVNRTALGALG